MGIAYNTSIVRDGLVLHLDAANVKSYPGSGTTWYDISGNNNNFTIETGLIYSNGTFNLTTTNAAAISDDTNIAPYTSCTVVYWIKTTELQALFLGASASNSFYLGAYREGNKEYYGLCGSPAYYQDLVEKSNIYDNFPDNQWHMVEFKNVDLSSWSSNLQFNNYGSFEFGAGSCSSIMLYNRVLTAEESSKNFEAHRGRFGI